MRAVHVNISNGPLDGRPPTDTSCEETGAVVMFLGVVRPTEAHTPIDGLEYSTYDPMAERILCSLAEKAIERFGVQRVLVEHSRGVVRAGECSFRLVVASAHRREAIDAVDWFIEQMKRDAPIWKRPIPSSAIKKPEGAAR